MHAMLITFESSVGLEDLRLPSGSPVHLADYSAALRVRPGFVAKTWLRDGDTFGGFYLFADRSAADRYLVEVIEPLGLANPAVSNTQVHHFDVNEEMSALTHGLPVAIVAA